MPRYNYLKYIFFPYLCLTGIPGQADDVQGEKIEIHGRKIQKHQIAGSQHGIDSQTLKENNDFDLNRSLQQIPGLYIQEEDGLGLRPNIGIRGAPPHRSRKINLQEDDILSNPAPYSEPAAYYVPPIERMSEITILKGPGTIPYGPQTIAGTVNMTTKPIPDNFTVKAASQLGSYGFRRYLGSIGGREGAFGYYLLVGRNQTDGFKDLDGGGSTGFFRDDALGKLSYGFGGADLRQQVEIKVGIGRERSDETYLGLTEEDFRTNPNRRYAASRQDEMRWLARQMSLHYTLEGSQGFAFTSDVYWRFFHRNWSKLNGFGRGGPSLAGVLADPQGDQNHFYRILTGEDNSLAADGSDALEIQDNDRTYYSRGVQAKAKKVWSGIEWENELQFGLRLHRDEVFRNHASESFAMREGDLQSRTGFKTLATPKHDFVTASSIYVLDRLSWQDWTLVPGYRLEWMENRAKDTGSEVMIENNERLASYGLGLTYSWDENLSTLLGWHRGTSPVGPRQDASINPEEADNFEGGGRYLTEWVGAELVAFMSRYRNLLGVCGISSGCNGPDAEQKFNGGKAEIYGVEASLQASPRLGRVQFPMQSQYTYSVASFSEKSQSNNPEWGVGELKDGDPLPYVPQHKTYTRIGVKEGFWHLWAALLFHGRMYDQAVAEGRSAIPAYHVWDLGIDAQVAKNWQVLAKVENVTDSTYLVSLRPYGHRPGKPRLLQLGVEWQM